jgi:very-short-patch-repair endonuclease
MRRNPADGESELWEQLRAKHLGFRFHRQAVLRGWIADFWCPAKRLIVEIDGGSHRTKNRKIRDSLRDNALREKLDIYTLRIPLEMVKNRLDEVVDLIRSEMNRRPTGYLRFGKQTD